MPRFHCEEQRIISAEINIAAGRGVRYVVSELPSRRMSNASPRRNCSTTSSKPVRPAWETRQLNTIELPVAWIAVGQLKRSERMRK